MADIIKFALALTLLAAGVVGFYLFSEQAMYVRVLSVLAGLAASVLVAWFTERGQRFYSFAHEAVDELHKVVRPSRKETVQMTMVVFAFVVVMAIFLWLADKSLEWVFYDQILGWKK